jgi:DNA-binding HxlR family transcriptional regulator
MSSRFTPLEQAMDQIVRQRRSESAWRETILIVVSLSQVPGCRARFSELEKVIPAISQRMLALTLRNLERDGLVTRELFPEVPPRVEYELTGLGKSLLEPTQALLDWVGNNWPDIKRARGKFAVKGPK